MDVWIRGWVDGWVGEYMVGELMDCWKLIKVDACMDA